LEAYSGIEKTAILLLALGDEFTTQVFKKLNRKDIAAISKAMLELETVSREDAEEILREFNQAVLLGKEMVLGGEDTVRKLLEHLDEETAKYVVDALGLDSGPPLFKDLTKVSPKILAQILRNEHPQTLALIIGHLPPEHAAELLENLPPGVRPDVLIRLAKLESVPEDMIREVDNVLQSQLIAIGGKEGRKVGGTHAVAEVLNAVEHSIEEEVLAEIEEESAQLAEEIRELMFVFDDIINLDDRSIQELLKEVSNEDLTLALKAASDELKEKFFKNMSERAANMIREDLEIMGPVKLSEVEAAQQNIIKIVRRLEAEGRIVIAGKGGEVLV
jgi:flagellar motor switch protein FliG